MQNNKIQHTNENETGSYVKPTITAYNVTTIRQALGPAVGFSGGRISDDELLFGDDS